MSARPGIIASAIVDANGGESPNRFKPYVSAEIRCHWPPLATDHEIGKALDDAMHDAFRQISAKRGTRDTRTTAPTSTNTVQAARRPTHTRSSHE